MIEFPPSARIFAAIVELQDTFALGRAMTAEVRQHPLERAKLKAGADVQHLEGLVDADRGDERSLVLVFARINLPMTTT